MHSARGISRHSSPISMLLLAALMIVSLTGVLGSGVNHDFAVSNADAALTVNTPAVIRNGEFFETRIRVLPRRDFADLVIAFEPSLWRDITLNTMIPAPAEETAGEGGFRFSYSEWTAGEPLEIKIDSQINPSLFAGTRGDVRLYDGETLVAELPIAMRVLP